MIRGVAGVFFGLLGYAGTFIVSFLRARTSLALENLALRSQVAKGHLEQLLREFIEEYYHPARPHQGLDGETPLGIHRNVPPRPTKLVSTPVCGGLHHTYARVAA